VAKQAAVAALLDVAAERGGATLLDSRHDTPFDPAEMGAAIVPERLAVAAEHVRHLQRRTHRPASVRGRDLKSQPVERTRRAADGAGGDLRVARRGIKGTSKNSLPRRDRNEIHSDGKQS
jgi:hypothetical protein